MKKVILIPDSFKGTMSSAEICTVMAQAVQEYYPDAQVHSVPVADGGEGSVDSVSYTHLDVYKRQQHRLRGLPLGQRMRRQMRG